jgi:hypothetical protein
MKTRELIAEAISLPIEERALIVGSLLRSLNTPESAIDTKWLAAAKLRLQQLESDAVIAVSDEEELEKLRNEVLRKIGRNVVLFQQIERMLKFLLTNGKHSGYVSELKKNQERRAATFHKKSMGIAVEQFLESTFTGSKESTSMPEDLKEVWISFNLQIESDDIHYEERKKALASLVDDRNELIHHLLPKWNFNSFESGKEIEYYLDQQREKILPEFEYLKALINTFFNTLKDYSDFITSEEGWKQIELSRLRQSNLVAWLFNIAEQMARSDGWMILTTAEQYIHQHAPEEVVGLKKSYGYKSLRDVILATEFCDVNEEQTNKGGIRVLYRIKPDLEFEN